MAHCGRSSPGRASDSHSEGSAFESRRPLHGGGDFPLLLNTYGVLCPTILSAVGHVISFIYLECFATLKVVQVARYGLRR